MLSSGKQKTSTKLATPTFIARSPVTARPSSLVPIQEAEAKYEHGTRARYVLAKCRCDDCRKANTEYQKSRDRRAKEASIGVAPASSRSYRRKRKLQGKVRKGEEKKVVTFIFKRPCPGVLGQPCPDRAYLRKDSGGACATCRTKLIGQIPAEPVRKHLAKLSRQGVGYKSVSAASDVGETLLMRVMHGKTTIRADLAHRVLQVDKTAASDRSVISAKATWKMIDELVENGMTKTEIAAQLGYKGRALQMRKDRVLAKTEHRVKKLYNSIMEEVQKGEDICPDCGLSHKPADRVALLKKMLPAPPRMVKRRYPCFYGPGSTKDNTASNRMMWRDIARAQREIALENKLEGG